MIYPWTIQDAYHYLNTCDDVPKGLHYSGRKVLKLDLPEVEVALNKGTRKIKVKDMKCFTVKVHSVHIMFLKFYQQT